MNNNLEKTSSIGPMDIEVGDGFHIIGTKDLILLTIEEDGKYAVVFSPSKDIIYEHQSKHNVKIYLAKYLEDKKFKHLQSKNNKAIVAKNKKYMNMHNQGIKSYNGISPNLDAT